MSRCRPDHVDTEAFVAARARIAEAYKRRGAPEAGRNVRAVLHRLQLTLFHAGKIDSLTRPASKPSVTVSGWAPIPQLYRDNAHRYIEQVRVSLSPSSVKHIEQHLRVFGTWLAEHHGGIRSCAELERDHIEDFKIWISTTPSARTGKPLARTSVKEQLINLGCFFERTTNWGYPNAPTRPLLFAGDLLRIDRPLPRFLDDAAAAKLARATRTEPDPLTRLGVANALARIANNAGIGHVTPHQLRHTLATQAINRPMSLEAIAALLGHKTLAMTMVYARIADKTVADEYFAVTDKVEALYNQPHQLPASDEGTEMRKLRARCTSACSATATAPDPSRSTATSNRSASPATSSSPPSSSNQRSAAYNRLPKAERRRSDLRVGLLQYVWKAKRSGSGCCWITARSSCMCSIRTSATSISLNVYGVTVPALIGLPRPHPVLKPRSGNLEHPPGPAAVGVARGHRADLQIGGS